MKAIFDPPATLLELDAAMAGDSYLEAVNEGGIEAEMSRVLWLDFEAALLALDLTGDHKAATKIDRVVRRKRERIVRERANAPLPVVVPSPTFWCRVENWLRRQLLGETV